MLGAGATHLGPCGRGPAGAVRLSSTKLFPTTRKLGAMPGAEPHTLVVKAADAGFFSNVNCVVGHLRHSLGRGGCEAVRVDWQLDAPMTTFTYGTAADGNLWERFYQALRFPNAPPAERVTRAYADFGMTGLRAYRMYKRGDRWRDEYGQAYRDHIRVLPAIRDRVDELWQTGMTGRFCVGVHIRHIDHSHECPRPIPEHDVFVERAKQLGGRSEQSAVFLATDAPSAVERFDSAFGRRLVIQPGVSRERVRRGQPQVGMPNPSLEHGIQVLVDALLLARCDVVLHTVSNIATAAGYINPALRMVYCEPKHVDAFARLRARLTRSLPPDSPAGMSHLQRATR